MSKQVLSLDYSPITSGHTALTVDNTAGGVGFTLPTGKVLNDISAVLVTCEGYQCRYTIDTVAPTTTVGHVLDPGGFLFLANRTAITNFRSIRTGASSATLMVTFFGGGR